MKTNSWWLAAVFAVGLSIGAVVPGFPAMSADAQGGDAAALQPQPAPGGGEMVLLDGRLDFVLQGRVADSGALQADCVHLPQDEHSDAAASGDFHADGAASGDFHADGAASGDFHADGAALGNSNE